VLKNILNILGSVIVSLNKNIGIKIRMSFAFKITQHLIKYENRSTLLFYCDEISIIYTLYI